MKAKNVAGIAALIATVVLLTSMLRQNTLEAQQSTGRSVRAVEYATLEINGQDLVSFRVGGNEVVRTESVRRTITRLGGSGNFDFIDLLNQIGRNGWILREKDDDTYIFTR